MAEQTREQLEEALRALTERSNSRGDVNNTSTTPASTPAAATVDEANRKKSGQASEDTGVSGLLSKLSEELRKLTKAITGIDFSGKDVANMGAGYASLKSLDDPSKTFSNAVNKFSDATGKFIPFISGITDTFKGLYNHLDSQRELALTGNRMGIGQGDPAKMEADAKAAGYRNAKEMLDANLNEYKNQLKGLGRFSDESVQKFNEVAGKVRSESPGVQNLIKTGKLRPEDIPALVAYVAGGKTDQLDTEAGKKQLQEQVDAYALQLAKQTAMYGLNADAVLKSNVAYNNNAEQQLRQQSLASDAERDQMRRNRDLAQGMGASFQEVMDKVYAGDQLTAKDQALLQVGSGNKSGQLMAAIRESKRTAGLSEKDPVRMAAEQALQNRLAEANQYQSSRDFARLRTTQDPEIKNAVITLQTESERKSSQAKTAQGTGGDAIKAAQQQSNIGNGIVSGRNRFNADGTVVPNSGAELSNTLSTIQEAYAKNTISLARQLDILNTTLGQQRETLNSLKEVLTSPVGGPNATVEDRNKANKATVDKVAEMFKNATTGITGVKPFNSPVDRTTNPVAAGQKTGTPVVNTQNLGVAANGPIEITSNGPVTIAGPESARTENPKKASANPTTTTTPVAPGVDRTQNPVRANRAHGTLAETGSPVEKADVVAQLHAGERVLSTDEVSKLANGVASSANLSAASLQKNNKIAVPAISTTATPTVGTTALPTVGTVKPVEAAFDNFDKVYNAVFKGTFDGVSQGMPRSSTTATQLTPSIDNKKETAANQFKNYPVKTGDTLTKISKDTGVSIEDIMKSNPAIKDRNKIYAGTNLEIPDVKVPAIPDIKVPAIPDVKVPAIPDVKVPAIPDIKVPAIPAPKVGVQIPDIKVPAIPDVKVPAIPAPTTASETAAELLRERRRGTPTTALPAPALVAPVVAPTTASETAAELLRERRRGTPTTTTTTTVGVKLPAVEGLSTNKNPINKESTKQNTNQSTSIGSIFDLISSKISTVKSVIPSTATDKSISIIEKPLIDETSKVSADGLNSKKLVDSISSTLTTVTGGGSVTRKEVQNEDAKAAEKQLAALTSQYKSDRAAINDVIREKLGPEAKGIDVIRAMRDNPQAKALEDRLKVASESLNNRIGAGTSTQTSFESGITKSQLVVKEPPSLSISEGMKGYNSILGEATVDEGDEEPKAINLNDAEPGSKDLHDQLIQLNTTMRQLVEHSADSLDKADALRRTTSSLSGNRFA